MYKLRLSISWQGIFICYDKDKEEKGSKPGKKMSVYQQTCMKLKWYKFIFLEKVPRQFPRQTWQVDYKKLS